MKKLLFWIVIIALIVGALVVGVVYKDNIVNSADQFIEAVKTEDKQEETNNNTNEETTEDTNSDSVGDDEFYTDGGSSDYEEAAGNAQD